MHAHLRVRLAERVDADRERALGREDARDLALVLGLRLADERRVVDEPVLGRVAARLERAEEGLLGAEDLDGGGGVLGQVGERARVRDEAGAHDVADECGEVWRNLSGNWTDYKSARMIGERVRVKQEGAFE